MVLVTPQRRVHRLIMAALPGFKEQAAGDAAGPHADGAEILRRVPTEREVLDALLMAAAAQAAACGLSRKDAADLFGNFYDHLGG